MLGTVLLGGGTLMLVRINVDPPRQELHLTRSAAAKICGWTFPASCDHTDLSVNSIRKLGYLGDTFPP